MSQFRGGPRYSDDTLGFREVPPRWDAERFTREREIRYNAPVLERERPFEGYGQRMEDRYATPPRREEPRFEEKFFAEERYGPPARRVDRQYYEEDEIYSSRPPAGGALVPYRRPEVPPPPRPGIIRRQSSLDTFDRRGPRRFDDFGPPPPPPRIPEPIPPRAPSYAEPRYADREYDDREYRYKEREWVTRKRDDSSSRDGFEREEFKEEVIEEVGEREKPFPRRGKTKMPRRLVSTKVLYDLKYPFYEEGDLIIIGVALGKENIDEVIGLSKTVREQETTTVHLIEAPPAQTEIHEEIIEKVETLNINEAPRSVREWDHLSVRLPSPARSSKSHRSHRSHRSHSRKPSHSRRGSSPEKTKKIIDVHSDVVTVRDVSPSRTAKSHRSHKSRKSRRSRSSSSSSSSSESRTRIVERREVLEFDQEESNSVHVGPLALVVQPDRERRKSRVDRDIQEQIRELEDERRKLERERKERDVVKVRRGTIVREVDEEVEVKKKKAPSAGVMRAMLATLT